jgi:spore coat protein CotF
MTITLTQKERTLLEDQKRHEEVCIQKYTNYANMTSDPQLKQIFLNNARIEQEHLNTINMLLSGQVPAMNQQSGMQQQQQQPAQQPQIQMQQPQVQRQQTNVSNVMQSQNNNVKWQNSSDKDCCTDMLMTEKYVSGAYDTAIFEFVDPRIRDLLNHIQKEEQKHGESIFVYMQNKGMYQPS